MPGLRADLASALHPAITWLRALRAKSLSRLQEMDLPVAKIAEIARSGAAWSRIRHLHLRSDRKAPRRRSVVLLSVAAAFTACLLFFVVLFSWALSDVPWEEIADGSLKPVVALETVDGKPLVSEGPIQGPYAKREDFPKQLIDAVLTSEDRHFFEHPGIDLKGILRAVYKNLGAGEVVQGGSTITQQVVKILYLERDRTWKRKIQEAVIAFWLEQKLGKNEFLRATSTTSISGEAPPVCRPPPASISTRKCATSISASRPCLRASFVHHRSSIRSATQTVRGDRRNSCSMRWPQRKDHHRSGKGRDGSIR